MQNGGAVLSFFSACSLRPRRLCGDNTFNPLHRRDAENAEVAQRISNWDITCRANIVPTFHWWRPLLRRRKARPQQVGIESAGRGFHNPSRHGKRSSAGDPVGIIG